MLPVQCWRSVLHSSVSQWRVDHLGIRDDHLGIRVDHLGIRVDHLGIRVDHLGKVTLVTLMIPWPSVPYTNAVNLIEHFFSLKVVYL